VSFTLKLVGRIVGEASPTNFLFVSDKASHPPKYEYVMVRSKEDVNGSIREVNVLAQVMGVISKSSSYDGNLNLDALERIYRAGIEDVNIICKAKTLGYIAVVNGRKQILMPRRAIYPGNPVYLAPDSFVQEFFSYPEEEGLHIGYLISRSTVPVYVSVNGFRRHLAILAQTGAGKSYTAGVLIEELLKKGATIIVIDPHADYVRLGRKPDGTPHEFSNRVKVFKNPNSTGRYPEDQLDNVIDYTVRFSDLDVDELYEIIGVPERWSNVRQSIEKAMKNLKEEKGEGYTVKDLIAKMKELIKYGKADEKRDMSKALKYVKRILKFKVFGDTSTSIEEMLKPMQLSVIDLSGLNDASMDYIASKVLNEVYRYVSEGAFSYPVFVVIEEAHRFVPPRNRVSGSLSREIINTIAAEGRKFGIFLILVSQRPAKIDPDTLSQCNSQIILRITNPSDQSAVRESSERVSESLLEDLPGLNVGEAVIVGEITKIPVMVKVRERMTMEGGADINVVDKLKRAKETLDIEDRVKEETIIPDTATLSEV